VLGSKPHVALTLAAAVALTFAGTARGDDPPRPDDVAAADAYRESVPTAAGPKPTGTGKRTARVAPTISARLGTDDTSALLREVVASPAYGAPQRRLRPPATAPIVDPDEERVARGPLPSVRAASGAVGDAVGQGRLVLLAVVLLVILGGGVAARLASARAQASRTG
jgi:hypothetical protein